MFTFVKEMIKSKENEFSLEERNLIGSSFKSYITNDRKALVLVSEIIAHDKFKNFVGVMAEFRAKIQKELVMKC